jgi:hypothetical protein
MAGLLVSRAALCVGIVAGLFGCGSASNGGKAGSPAVGTSTTLEHARASQYDIRAHFASYEQALRVVRSTYDCDVEEVSRSSVVFGAEYCDEGNGQGYLIVNLRGREYIHAGVPAEIWEEFRGAESMGNYYAAHLRGRYRLTLAH